MGLLATCLVLLPHSIEGVTAAAVSATSGDEGNGGSIVIAVSSGPVGVCCVLGTGGSAAVAVSASPGDVDSGGDGTKVTFPLALPPWQAFTFFLADNMFSPPVPTLTAGAEDAEEESSCLPTTLPFFPAGSVSLPHFDSPPSTPPFPTRAIGTVGRLRFVLVEELDANAICDVPTIDPGGDDGVWDRKTNTCS